MIGEAVVEALAGFVRTEGESIREEDVAAIQAFIDVDDGDAGFRIALADGSKLDAEDERTSVPNVMVRFGPSVPASRTLPWSTGSRANTSAI